MFFSRIRASHRAALACALAAGACLLVACAQLPASVAELGWQDRYGDRGRGVLARDYEMCAELVEQRRGLLGSCMASRGWDLGLN